MAKRTRSAAERAAQAERLRARPARGRILAAASELAEAKGYESLTVGELAERAGVSRETFYTHFSGKRACLAEVVDVRLGNIDACCRSGSDDGEPWAESLRVALEAALTEHFDSDSGPKARIITAMLDQVEKTGYEATNLRDVIGAARSSHPVFYRHFEGKRECFVAACASLLGQVDLRADAVVNLRGAGGEAGAKLVALAEILAESPSRARILLLDAAGLGADATGTTKSPRTLDELIKAVAMDLGVTSDLSPTMLGGAVIEILRRAVLCDQLDEAPARVAELVEGFRPKRAARARSSLTHRGLNPRRGRRLATIA